MGRRRPTRTLADVPVRALREALRALPTLHAVALHFRVSDNAVRYWRAKLDLTPARSPSGGPALRAQLLRTLQDCPRGATVAELRRLLPLSHSACNYALRCLEASGDVRRWCGRPPHPGRRALCWHAIR